MIVPGSFEFNLFLFFTIIIIIFKLSIAIFIGLTIYKKKKEGGTRVFDFYFGMFIGFWGNHGQEYRSKKKPCHAFYWGKAQGNRRKAQGERRQKQGTTLKPGPLTFSLSPIIFGLSP